MPREQLAELDWLNGDIHDLRAKYEEAHSVAKLENCTWFDAKDRGRTIHCLMHAPGRPVQSNSLVVHFHGGGWIVGSPRTHADIARGLCDGTGLPVISVDYRLAPEHPAPAPIEDGSAVLQYLFANPSGYDSAVLCGDSAGAAIALGVEQAACPVLRRRISAVASLYGGFGLIGSLSQRKWGRREEGLDTNCIRRMWELANGGLNTTSPYSIASLAKPSNVPAYLMAGEHDPLLDDSLELAEAMRLNGRKVVMDVVETEGHGFLHAFRDSQTAVAAMRRLCSWIALKCTVMGS